MKWRHKQHRELVIQIVLITNIYIVANGRVVVAY